MEPSPPRVIEKTPEIKRPASDTIRVPLERVEKNHDITSEIFLIRNQIAHLLTKEIEAGHMRDSCYLQWEVLDSSMRQRIIELENIILSMRMTSVKSLFARMEKTVRSYCRNSPKKIKVVIEGEETELDKKILDSLADPMIHLIRNAMDHGIEAPADRLQFGKKEEGTIRLSAHIAGNEALIEITDDGKGMDPQKIIQSAKKKGIDTTGVKTDAQGLQLIFAPGFSTAAKVSDVSGRGVGMDAVKTYVDRFGGRIKIHTKIGQGTTFALHLPIGLSVIPSIIVCVGDQLFGVPTFDIVETLSTTRSKIICNDEQLFVDVSGKFVECFYLDQLFDHVKQKPKFLNSTISLLVCRVQASLIGFIADSIKSNTELIVKPLPECAPSFSYLDGIAVLASGQPSFVVSLPKLAERLKGDLQTPKGIQDAA